MGLGLVSNQESEDSVKRFALDRTLRAGFAAALIAAIAACTTAPPPPPPPKVVKAERRPYPPFGASPNLTIPAAGVDGTRLTINSNLSSRQAAWNLRSAYNVAALNCMSPEHAPLVADYGDFLKTHERTLKSINNALDSEFKAQYGRKYIAHREVFQTQVYNYFALPPTMPSFCDTALSVGQELKVIPSGQLESYAPAALARLEGVFLDFFNRYEQYRRDFVQWQIDYTAKYGSPPSDGYFLPGETRYQPQPVATVAPSMSSLQAGAQ